MDGKKKKKDRVLGDDAGAAFRAPHVPLAARLAGIKLAHDVAGEEVWGVLAVFAERCD